MSVSAEFSIQVDALFDCDFKIEVHSVAGRDHWLQFYDRNRSFLQFLIRDATRQEVEAMAAAIEVPIIRIRQEFNEKYAANKCEVAS